MAFQQHIQKESGFKPDIKVEGDYRHAYVGALLAKQLLPKYHVLIDNALMGHHRGLYDHGEMIEMLKRPMPNEVSIEKVQANLTLPKVGSPKDIHHLQRMLYSCLVDADYLDTEAFMQPDQSKLRGGHSTIKQLEEKLDSFLRSLKENAFDSGVVKSLLPMIKLEMKSKIIVWRRVQAKLVFIV